jgi:hypothetical protein
MHKKIGGFLLCIVLLLALPYKASAANRVNSMDIQAVINEDGSMYITQVWEGNFTEGTENYIPMNAPGYLTISNLFVSDQNGPYVTLSDWDIDRSFDEKARKCGINYIDGGYEICFGISQYGQNTYVISYKLDNVVASYSDMDGVNFRFVNDEMNTTPTDVTVWISLADDTPITDEIADIWGFGYTGDVVFENGSIVARTSSPITASDHLTVMFAFKKGVLSPSRQEQGSFEEVKERAFKGSDYDYDYGESDGDDGFSFIFLITMFLAVVVPIGTLIWSVISKIIEKRKLRKFSEAFGYYRDIPNEGNLSASYALGRMFNICQDGAVLATGMLRLIQLGCLTPVETRETGFMGKSKETVNLQLTGGQRDGMGEFDEYLYAVLEGAAGPDAVLQAKELERYASQYDTVLRSYIQKHESAGKAYLSQKGCLKRWRAVTKLADLTPSGEQELGELIGLKRYLEDFSLISERGVKEIYVWRELLTYAMLFGIADQVTEQMKKLYPELTSELTEFNRRCVTAHSYHYVLYSNMRKAEIRREQIRRSSGSGGSASRGGGGGSIGGRSGGGSR